MPGCLARAGARYPREWFFSATLAFRAMTRSIIPSTSAGVIDGCCGPGLPRRACCRSRTRSPSPLTRPDKATSKAQKRFFRSVVEPSTCLACREFPILGGDCGHDSTRSVELFAVEGDEG